MENKKPSNTTSENGRPTDEALLVEYQVGQQAINANASRYWTIVGIFIPVSTGVLAWVVYVITSNSSSLINVNAKWLVLVLGVGIIVILVLLWYWLGRVNYFVRIRYFRMQEIEGELGMLANLTIHWLDHPKEVPNEQSGRINKLRTSYPAPPLKETTCLRWIFCALGTIWVFFILLFFLPWYFALVASVVLVGILPRLIAWLIKLLKNRLTGSKIV